MTTSYSIRGMHCQSCVKKIQQALSTLNGVTAAEVSLKPPAAKIQLSNSLPFAELNAAVKRAGSYELLEQSDASLPVTDDPASTEAKPSLYPLGLIVGYLVLGASTASFTATNPSLHEFMRLFMAGFFLVFSFFKLLNLRGFAAAYQGYDVVAQAWPAWALIYPFVELGLGIAYLADFSPRAINWLTLALMLVGSIGVFKALAKRRAIRCACLGTVLNLPMTTVTLVEDLGMAAMAAYMLMSG